MKVDIEQLKFIHPILRSMIVELEKMTGIEFTITSLYRPGDSGVHGTMPVRGMDLRCRSGNLGRFLQDRINTGWVYDPARPDKYCALYHDSGHGAHLHVQVHPDTKRM